MDSMTTIIEARQKASNSFAAGDYETILAEPVMLRTGDELMLKTASIDTTNVVAGTVLLEEAVPIDVQALLYVTNHWYDDKTYFSGIESDGKPTNVAEQPDFRRYFACSESNTTAVFLTSIEFKDLRAAFYFQLSYTNVNGKQVTQTYHQPSTHHDSTVAINVYYKPSDAANPTSGLVISGIPTVDDGKPAGTFSKYHHGASSTVNVIYEPKLVDLSFSVPAGTYTPDELCKYINDEMTRTPSYWGENGFAGKTVASAPFFRPNAADDYMVADTLRQNEDKDLVSDGFTFVNAVLNKADAGKLPFLSWIGASQIQLQFTNDKFSFKYMHTPFYDPDGNVSVTFNYESTRTFAPWGTAGSLGGLAFTKLSPATFWGGLNQDGTTGQLGFDLNNCLASYTHTATPIKNPTNNGTAAVYPEFAVTTGQQTTRAFVGADTMLIKNVATKDSAGNTKSPPPTVPHQAYVPRDATFTTTVSIDETEIVEAAYTRTQLQQNTGGYFLIDTQSVFSSQHISTTTSRTTQAIVSRYYNSGSYTTADSSSGIMYTHVGAPQMLKSLRVRILEPDGTLSGEIGSDNAVFFQLQRNSPAPPTKTAKK